MKPAPLCPRTLRYVARELIGLAEAFYKSPNSTVKHKDVTRADILSVRGRIYLAQANALARKQTKERRAKKS